MAKSEHLAVALQWTLDSLISALAGKPVRDADEVIEFARIALEQQKEESDEAVR